MFLRLLTESLRRARRRKLLAVAVIALSIAAATALGAVLLASGDRLASELAAYGANLDLAAADGGTFAVDRLSAIRHIFWRHAIVGVAPLYPLRARLGGAEVAPLVGTWFAQSLEPGWTTGLPATRPSLRPQGRWPKDCCAEAAVGRRLAARLKLGIGDRLPAELGGERADLLVVGLVGGGGEEEEQAFVPLAIAQRLAGHGAVVPRAEVLAITAPETADAHRDPKAMTPAEYDRWYCTAYPSSIAHQLEEAMPGVRARVVRGVAGAAGEVLGRLRGVLVALTLLLLAGAIVGTMAAMTATSLERRLEAGLFLALGAERGQIAGFFLAEAAILGVGAGLLGGLGGLAAGRWLGAAVFSIEVPWAPVLLPVAVGAGVVVALLGSLPPLLRTLDRDTALQLKRATA